MPQFKDIWNKFRTNSIMQKLQNRPILYKIAINTGWLMLDKLIKIVVSLVMVAWVARYMGPSQYGTFSYAIAFVALFTPIAGLGLNDIVIREIVHRKEQKNEILSTAIILQFFAGIVALGLAIGFSYISNADDHLLLKLILILSGQLVIQAWNNTLQGWFQSQVESKYRIWSQNIALIVISLVQVVLILTSAPLEAFAWALLAQMVLIGIVSYIFYLRRTGHAFVWQVSFVQAKRMLENSWPLLISGIAMIIYEKIDQIMLGNMVGDEALGIYSVAVRLSELWYFIPSALATSFFPAILNFKMKKSDKNYQERMQLFFDLMAGVSYVVIIFTVLLAPYLVSILFGSEYAGASTILRIHILALVFVSLGGARRSWLIAEDFIKFTVLATILGAVSNIMLNLWLVPRYAGLGAAWATLISYGISAYFSTILIRKLRPLWKQLSLSLLIPFRVVSFVRSFNQLMKDGKSVNGNS